ncbi:MAG TPA: AAC(3) family N-acetyltransferase [Solirubrobacteraceae bacterium]|jgi:aminoglycoside 3-N-acetyltransferase|nr:AAC(3) family N-acetyltransferase [Solirubrobacteraceae bacterium]
MSPTFDYRHEDLVCALRTVGVRERDVLFTHSSLAMLGIPGVSLDAQEIARMFLSAVREVAGVEGTWLLPTYTYSYTKHEVFDPATVSPTADMGVLPNALWRHPEAVRSLDPIFSVIAIGARAEELTAGMPTSCFGDDSVYARLLEVDGAILNIGMASHSAFLHHVEQKLGVPYRYPKWFRGISIVDGERCATQIAYNVRDLDRPEHLPHFIRIDRDGRADGSLAAARLGRGEINLMRATRMEELARAGLARRPDYLVVGSAGESGE